VARGLADESLVVRITANDTMHEDDVGVAESAVLGEVTDLPVDALRDACFVRELRRRRLVTGRVLDVHGSLSAGLEQLELNGPDAAADLEHLRAGDSFGDERIDDPLRGRPQAPAPIALGVTTRHLLVEHVSVPRGSAAVHAGSLGRFHSP
jgi:hypothetical protein